MNRLDVLRAVLQGAAGYVPGGAGIKEGIEALITRNADPSDDVAEVSAALTKIVVGAVKAIEGITEKDYVDDAAVLALSESIKRDIELLQRLFIKRA